MLRRHPAKPILLAILLLAVSPLWGQQEQDPPTVPSTTAPDDLRSARATMTTFLGAFYVEGEPDLQLAARCLDLSDLPPSVRALKGGEIAIQLKGILDRSRLIDVDEIPDDPDGQPYQFERYASGTVTIAHDDSGRWRFTAETVRDVSAIFAEVRDRGIVEGVARPADLVTPSMWLRSMVPSSLTRRVFVLEAWQWIGLLVIVFVGVVVGRTAGFAASAATEKILLRRVSGIDRNLVTRTVQPAVVLLTVLVWGFGAAWIGLPVEVLRIYIHAVEVIAVAALVVTAYRLVEVFADILSRRASLTETRFDDLLVPLIRKSLKVFIVAVGLVMVLQSLEVEVAGLLAGLGLGGLAFALAAQDTVANLFGSATVLLDRPFQVGDWIKVGEVEGTVEEMGFRSTRVRTFYNSLITMPNSALIKASVDNLGARSYRRWSTRLGVAYSTPPEAIDAFCEGIRELVRRHPYTRKDYFHVYLNDFGGSSLEIMLYVFFQTPEWATELRERHRLAVDIVRLAAELGVEFAFPTQTVFLRREAWQPPGLAGERYPAERDRLLDEVRQRARRIALSGTGGNAPPPVSFDDLQTGLREGEAET